MMKTIQYGINENTGHVCSRLGSEVAIPVLEYDKMSPENNFETVYQLEKFDIITLASQWNCIHWTRKLPVELKNTHRSFWGFKPLRQ